MSADAHAALLKDLEFYVEHLAARPRTPWDDGVLKLLRLSHAALAAETVPPREPQWQPIESAPKDGTPLLLWWHDEYSDEVVDVWACAAWRVFGDGSRGWVGESFHASEAHFWTRLIGESPTHWMPLPAPPAIGAASPRAASRPPDIG